MNRSAAPSLTFVLSLLASLSTATLPARPAQPAAPPAGGAAATRAAREVLDVAVRSPSERSGDQDRLAASLVESVAAHPNDFRAELPARRLRAVLPSLRDPAALIAPIERALAGKPGPNGVPRQVLVDALADLYRLAGREEDRKRILADRGFVLSWLIAGPFGKGKAAPMGRVFAPEKRQDLDSEYEDGWQKLAWRKVLREAAREPLLNPGRYVYPATGVSYLLAQVHADEARPALLYRGSGSDLKIWLNGTLVCDDDTRNQHVRSRRKTGVQLLKGWNRILVKTAGSFWLRFTDPQDEPLGRSVLRQEASRVLHSVESPPDPRWDGPFRKCVLDAWADWITDLEGRDNKEDAAKRLLADAHIGLALLYRAYNRPALAVAQAKAALEILPQDPPLLFQAGEIYASAGYLPATISKNRSKTSWESALEHDPDFVPAYERLAGLLAQDEQYVKAIEKIREGLAKGPLYLPLLLQLKAIHNKQKGNEWQPEEIAAVREIAKVAPRSTVPDAYWSAYYRNLGNDQEAERILQEGYRKDGRQLNFLGNLSWMAQRRGDLEAAEKHLRKALALDPDYRDWYIQFLTECGRFDDALKEARVLAEKNPLAPGPLVLLGNILDEAGKKQQALDHYRKALALEPGNLSLKRYLASVPPKEPVAAGREDAFWRPYDEKAEDWIQRVPTEGPLVEKAAYILVLDISVLRIEVDGSSSEYVHQIHKLLTEESKEELANVSTGEETIALRTITASGESLEPVAGEGKWSYVMPGLTPGAFIEEAHRSNNGPARGRRISGERFFFQDSRFQSPFLLSRFVVMAPKDMDIRYVETQLDAAAESKGSVHFARVTKKKEALSDGTQVVVYEARNVERLESEQFMPSAGDYFPNVEVLQPQTWTDVAAALRSRSSGRTRLTPELREAAREATREAKSPFDKVLALYDYVNELVPSSGGMGQAVSVLLTKSGDRTTLFKALLDALDIPCEWAYLRPREAFLPRTRWEYPNTGMFPSVYIHVQLEGRDPLYLSLSRRKTPFGRLPVSLQGGKALILTPTGQRITLLPSLRPEENATSTLAALTLEKDLAVKVDLRLISRSLSAFAQKDRLKSLPAFQKNLALRGIANRMFPGAKVESADFGNLEDRETPFSITLKLTAPKFLRQSGDDVLLRTVIQPIQLVRAFCGRATREHPFHFRSQLALRDSLLIESGKTHRLLSAPADTVMLNQLGTYSLSFTPEGGALRVKRQLTLQPGRLSPEEFPAFVDFCRKVDAAEQESIIFRPR